MVEWLMVFYTPPLQRTPAPATPPAKDRPVLGVNRIEPRAQREERGQSKRSLRHRLIDLVMDEVDSLPDLSSPQKQRIRSSLDRFATTHADQNADPAADGKGEQPAPSPPPPVPIQDHVGDVVAGIVVASSDIPSDGVDAVHLASEMRRLLALHTECAVKIASYIHALMAVTPDSHQIDLDI